jgi:hypothetical protein
MAIGRFAYIVQAGFACLFVPAATECGASAVHVVEQDCPNIDRLCDIVLPFHSRGTREWDAAARKRSHVGGGADHPRTKTSVACFGHPAAAGRRHSNTMSLSATPGSSAARRRRRLCFARPGVPRCGSSHPSRRSWARRGDRLGTTASAVGGGSPLEARGRIHSFIEPRGLSALSEKLTKLFTAL